MESELLSLLVKEAPAVVILGVFAVTLLKIVIRILDHYQEMFAGVLGKILERLDAIDERTKRCPRLND